MIVRRRGQLSLALLAGASAIAIASAAPAAAEEAARSFDIPAQPLSSALLAYSRQTDTPVIASMDLLEGKTAPAIHGDMPQGQALAMLLQGTGLRAERGPTGSIVVERITADPQSGSAAGDGADQGTVQALIVTAQKREENIQDVPIAMSAFTQEDLTKSQVAGGPDLMTQVPNFTFTKTNFTGYSIQIRGIGTQAISATTDPAVAVAFNNTPFIRNRFFEQEFYDLERVEVLRGPQGTLYGRNATAGVVNIISAKPHFDYEAKLSADVGNYNSVRLEGMVNLPLVDDKVALRVAGAWTKRDGYDTNSLTGNRIDGRDLWSSRVSLRVQPTDRIDANLVWEHFEENDDRLRSGKQVCNTDNVSQITAVVPDGQALVFQTDRTTPLPSNSGSQDWTGVQGTFSQGCKPASMYAPESYQTPNGISLPFVLPMRTIGAPINSTTPYFDAYASRTQSRDLRSIESVVDPTYRAKTDVVELQFKTDLTDRLTLASETGYGSDFIFSSQDYNRFNTAPGVFDQPDMYYDRREGLLLPGPNGGIFCDPQIGCSDRLVAVDLSTAKSTQFSQEFRLSSNYEAPFNFSLGANFLRYDTEDKYYLFINTVTAYAAKSPYAAGGQGGSRDILPPYVGGVSDNVECLKSGFQAPNPMNAQSVNGCEYIDPNPISNLNDLGHNYFLSKNPFKLISYAVFGEAYYNIAENLKLTAGLRWTVDKKAAPRIPSWLIAADTVGYPVAEVVKQEWREPTGRLALDWKPDLSFTDETLVYGSYAHGYKAGGMNPPAPGIVCYFCSSTIGAGQDIAERMLSATHPKTFAPEFVNAFEVGSKNTLLDGRLTLNGAAFYYDYKGYQISQIVNRSAVNLNFDARVWGLELEADWRPVENLRLGFKGGYENTRVADGMKAIDLMDRTAGDPNWVVVRPFPTFPSNCIAPAWLFVGYPFGATTPGLVDIGNRGGGGGAGFCELAYVQDLDPVTGLAYAPNPTDYVPGMGSLPFHPDYPGWNPATAPNHGAGISKNLSGNELPNAPHFTATVTADYTVPLPSDWLMTLHGDFYYQSEAWARIFNTPGYDKLKAYTNVNLAAIFTNEEAGWKVMAYVKNVFDKTNITGSFLNSDDTGLTTNVFLNEPRLYGLRVTKEWNGGPWWTGANPNHKGPYPLTIEIGGQVQRQDAPYQPITSRALASLPPQLNINGVQNRGLDWGDGRSVKVTYRPDASDWWVAAAIRYGETNNGATRANHLLEETDKACAYPGWLAGGFYKQLFCDPASQYYAPSLMKAGIDWSEGSARSREEDDIVDFNVGRDVGLGSTFAKSAISVGIRYGGFKSSSSLQARGAGDWYVPEGWIFAQIFSDKYQATHRGYNVDLEATREFKGAGPTMTWEAATPLVGNNETGHLDLDWAVTGGVLFGKQKTEVNGKDSISSYSGYYGAFPQPIVGEPQNLPLPEARSRSVSVPLVEMSLGLSYDIQRVKLSTGYRWERYFNVLDAGYTSHKSYDRTFDGPYFKIAVGFGG